MAITANEAGAVHGIGSSVENRLKQPRILGRVVFQIGVPYENHVASGKVEPSAERRAFPAILFVKNYSHARQRSELLKNRSVSHRSRNRQR